MRSWCCVLLACALLAACSNGGDDAPPATTITELSDADKLRLHNTCVAGMQSKNLGENDGLCEPIVEGIAELVHLGAVSDAAQCLAAILEGIGSSGNLPAIGNLPGIGSSGSTVSSGTRDVCTL